MRRLWKRRRSSRIVVAVVLTLGLLVPLGWLWAGSLVPGSFSVMGMGHPDYGGGTRDPAHDMHAAGWDGPPPAPGDVPVTDVTGTRSGDPDVDVTLVARSEMISLSPGATVEGLTLNHTSPGPTIRARQGELVQVRLINESVERGTTLHGHGADLPNAEDGVAGITQDAVPPGGEHVYRFVAEDPGTYWYHSHQASHIQVREGLFGVLVVEPPTVASGLDVVAAVHTYPGGRRTVDGTGGEKRVPAAPGTPVRVRVVNTDNGPLRTQVAGAPFRVLTVDGRDIDDPGEVTRRSVQVPAGGRADLGLVTPTAASRLRS